MEIGWLFLVNFPIHSVTEERPESPEVKEIVYNTKEEAKDAFKKLLREKVSLREYQWSSIPNFTFFHTPRFFAYSNNLPLQHFSRKQHIFGKKDNPLLFGIMEKFREIFPWRETVIKAHRMKSNEKLF